MIENKLYIAANDSLKSKKKNAKVICDGNKDAEEINKAIKKHLPNGGTLLLASGTYIIKKSGNENYGGLVIDKDNMHIIGEGKSTKLILGDNQDCNVIQIKEAKNVTISSLYIDGNRLKQSRLPDGTYSHEYEDPHFRSFKFNISGIKADKYEGDEYHPENVVVENCCIKDCKALGVMLTGKNMIVKNNYFGSAMCDVVEILKGPGEIKNNHVVIEDIRSHTALSTDLASNVAITDNMILVKKTGRLDMAFRSWQHSLRHVFKRNKVVVEKGGRMDAMIDSRGPLTKIEDNTFINYNDKPVKLSITGLTSVKNNKFYNIIIGIRSLNPKYLEDWKRKWKLGFIEDFPVQIKSNQFVNSFVHKKGDEKNVMMTSNNDFISI